MTDQMKITLDDGTTLLIYRVYSRWWWSHRNPNIDSIRDGHLATSGKSFLTRQAAERDFFMHNDYDDKRDQKAPWPLIAGIVLAIATMLAIISLSTRAHSHDIYEGWKIGTQNCCHDVHCFPTQVKKFPDGIWRVLDRDGETWLPIDEERIDFASPFPGSHGCVMVDPDDGDHVAVCAAVGGSA